MDKGIEEVLNKYRRALEEHMEIEPGTSQDSPFSKEYSTFKQEALTKTITNYENYCNTAEKIFKVSPKPKERNKLLESIDITHLNITPEGAMGLSILAFVFLMFISIVLGLTLFLATGELKLGFPLLLLVLGIFLIKPISNYPHKLASQWRLKAGNQMVLCILYIVMYMRHTPNLEHAIKFAGEHLSYPLNLDMRKVLWDVETGKFSTIQESLNNYLLKWKSTNIEFLESFNLIQGSLQQSNKEKRENLLEKALQIVLEGTYDKMMNYAHNLKNPITMLHMLGIILPILGLIILPLIGTFLGVKWYHLAIIYNVLLPILVWYYGNKIILSRPAGYGETEEDNPIFKKLSQKPEIKAFAIFIIFIFCLIGFSPLLIHLVMPSYDANLGRFGNFLDYQGSSGPFGVGAALLGLFIPLGIGIGMGYYYKQKTKELIKIREQTKRLEIEFSSSLFQLGNKISDGIPAEVAFAKVGENMQGTSTGKFFNIVNINIRKLGMDIRSAIFNPKTGAIKYFPSSLIQSSMRILVQGIRKGPLIVSKSLISISTYINRLHKINERIKDLLADIISSMKGQINFLAPMIAGITVGIGTMITTILGKLSIMVGQSSGGEELGTVSELISVFPVDKMMPPFFFQLVVGIYVLEVVWILTSLSNGIENGVDKIKSENSLGKNLNKSLITYTIIAMIVMIIFSLLAGVIANVEGI